jgi:hypothetical protein
MTTQEVADTLVKLCSEGKFNEATSASTRRISSAWKQALLREDRARLRVLRP